VSATSSSNVFDPNRLRSIALRLTADDHDGMEKEVVGAARALLADHPDVKVVVLECTNMPPFSAAVEKATGKRVYDILTLGKWLYNGAVQPSHQSAK